MQTWKTRFRRIAAMVCALALCASLLPAGALANNTDGIDVDESSSSQVVTGTEPTEEEKTEETGTETEQPAEEAETEETVEEETEEPAEEPEEEPAETVGDGTDETSEKTVTVEQEPEVTDEEPAVTDEPETEEEAVQTARTVVPMNEGETDNTENQSIVLNDGQYITVKDADGDGRIATSIGTIIYDTNTTEDPEGGLNPYYKISVELYVNGQLEVKTDALTLNNRRHGALFIEPAAGYYYHTLGEDTTNAYTFQMDGTTNHSWDDLTGYLDINGGSPNGTDNVLQIRLWTFEAWSTLTVRKGLINDNDDVTGYQISFEAINPVTNAREIFTYDATAFGVAERQIVPNNTRVTLTGVCNPYYEIAEWDKALEASDLCDFNGDEGRNEFGSVYGNTVTLDLNYINNNGRPVNEIVIRDQEAVSAPSEDKVKDILTDIGDNLVKVDCVGTSDHEAVTYGLLDGGWSYDVNQALGGDSVSDYTVTVTINANTYLAKYNEGNADHALAENEGDKTITLRYVAGQWTAEGYPVTINVTCDNGGGQPGDEGPDEPTSTEIDTLLDVKVTCANNVPTHKETIYSVNYYTLGEVTSSDNGNTYTCVVTIPSANYIVDFNDASGMQHTCATESEEVTLVATKVDNVWKWQLGSGEKSMVEFQATCKPDDPTDDEIKILFGDTTLQVKCINESASHDAHTFALQDETFEVASVDFENGTYIATVNIAKAPYRDLYNEEVGTVHSLVDDTTVVTATLLYNGNEWVLPENATVTIDVTCDTTTDPGTDKPDEPTAEELTDAFGSKILVLCNQKNPNHYRGLRGAYYWLNQGNFSFTEVRQDADNGYYVEVTVEPGRYVELFSQATGVNHTLVSGQGNQTFRMYYTKGVWTPDVQQVTFNVTCSWTTVSGGDTPKDEHPEVGKAIANGTWGTPTPTPAASATSTIPQTSDSMPIGLLAGTAAIAAAAIALLLVLRKRRQQ